MDTTSQGMDLVEQWRNDASMDNPAGPLFIGGEFTEADIICETGTISGRCGTACTGSRTLDCC
ncbi:hypothetical protein HPC49_13705 [Pyxidicoccus fallax]|uniref:Uncharacterized protein n=1 Tax=Pyxidicoccus fallax TaxID=394095 RepID=A0A848L6S7_9BACT|nr:DUF6229 family protein [Pyxidicoccus fallax]NMO14296.1 hypothetical protein [Pyxidicoccus fallax]NPC79289.1 hypothetical protein [Pyxidicoccus fallax]